MVAAQPGLVREGVEQHQTGLRTVPHRHRRGAVDRDDRRGRQGGQDVVERDDLRPVGGGDVGGLVVQRGDRGLHAVRARRATGQRHGHESGALGDESAVPACTVLVREQNHRALRPGPGVAARVGQQHQGEQPGHLPLTGQQPVQDPGQPESLVGEVRTLQVRPGTRGVSLGEDRVQHLQYTRQPLRQFVPLGHPERNAGLPDLLLRPHDPLRHRRGGDQEGPRHLGRPEPGQAPQGQRHPVLGRQRRVSAGEVQLQALVGHVAAGHGGGRVVRPIRIHLQDGQPGGVGLIPPEPVDGLAPRRRQQPGPRLGRHAPDGPVHQRRFDRLAGHVLGQVEVAEAVHEGGEQPPPLLPEHRFDGCVDPRAGARPVRRGHCPKSAIGRTTTDPPPRAPGQRAAQSSATSRSGTSTT